MWLDAHRFLTSKRESQSYMWLDAHRFFALSLDILASQKIIESSQIMIGKPLKIVSFSRGETVGKVNIDI